MRVGLENQSRASCVRGFIYSSVPSIPFALIVAPARSLARALLVRTRVARAEPRVPARLPRLRDISPVTIAPLTVRRRKRRRLEASPLELVLGVELLNGIGNSDLDTRVT